MPSPPPSLLLAIAERIDFDARVRAAVEADPLVVLTGMGLDAASAMALVEDVGEAEVSAFAAAPSPIAVRAHRWAMALLREGGGSIPYRSRTGGSPALAWPPGRADVDGVHPAAQPPGAPR